VADALARIDADATASSIKFDIDCR